MEADEAPETRQTGEKGRIRMRATEQSAAEAGRRRQSNGTRATAPAARPGGWAVPPRLAGALQRTAGNAVVSRMVQGRPRVGDGDDEAVQRSTVHDVLRSAGRPLGESLRTEMEARLGADFSDVRLHTGSRARASAAEVGARAYTSGNHVVIGQGGANTPSRMSSRTSSSSARAGSPAPTTVLASACPTPRTASSARPRPMPGA
ncbi:hypothetical protein GCM10023324_08110 [Streptomyces youssoufiensis]